METLTDIALVGGIWLIVVGSLLLAGRQTNGRFWRSWRPARRKKR